MRLRELLNRLLTRLKRHPIRNSSVAILLLSFAIGSQGQSTGQSAATTTTVAKTSTTSWTSNTTETATYQECLSSWESANSPETTIPGSIGNSFENSFGCYDFQLFCDEYKTLQRELVTLEADISLGYAIPSDATQAIEEFATQLDGFDFTFVAKDDYFATTALEAKSAYRALRIAYLKGQNARANILNNKVAPLNDKLSLMCEPVPMVLIDDE